MPNGSTTFWSTRLERHLTGLELISLAAEALESAPRAQGRNARRGEPGSVYGLSTLQQGGPAPVTRSELRDDFRRMDSAKQHGPNPARAVSTPPPAPTPPAPILSSAPPVAAPNPKLERLLAAAGVNDEQATLATLDDLRFTPRASVRQRSRKDSALIKGAERAIENGHCATTKAMWDRCTWGEWKAAAQARIGVAAGPMRELIFELSLRDWPFTLRLFPDAHERERFTSAILDR